MAKQKLLHSLQHKPTLTSSRPLLQVCNPHWGKNWNFLLKIEKLDIKIGPIFGFGPSVDTLAYPKIHFSGQNLVWFGQGALLKMWENSKIFTLVQNCFKNIPLLVTFLALVSLVELH